MDPVGPALPLRRAYRTRERAVRHPRTVREQDLRATALDIRLVTIGGGEVRERRLGALSLAPRELARVSTPETTGALLAPLGRALRARERVAVGIEAAPLDDPVLAAIAEDDALSHVGFSPRSQHSTAFCA